MQTMFEAQAPAQACFDVWQLLPTQNRSILVSVKFVVTIMLVLSCAIAPVQAQDGGCVFGPLQTGPIEIFPASGAGGVSLNAPLRVRFSSGFFAGYSGSLSSLLYIARMGASTPTPGALVLLGDTLVFSPSGGWSPNATYVGVTTGDSVSQQIRFTTALTNDTTAPFFEGDMPQVASQFVGSRCDLPNGGYRIDVGFSPAGDNDGAPGDIEYLLFETRGANLTAPVLRARERNYSTSQITVGFVLSKEDASKPLCVLPLAVDDVGHVASGTEACFNPADTDGFQPLCSIGYKKREAPVWLLASLPIILLARKRRRNR